MPYNPFEHQVVDKKPYPTLSGRITLSRRCSPKGRTTTTTQSRYRTSIQRANEMATGVKRQLGMVMDLNKCIGCHTCTSACKMQWTNRNGREYMYWNNVETQPAAATRAATRAVTRATTSRWAEGSTRRAT